VPSVHNCIKMKAV